MKSLIISPATLAKLHSKHNVVREEVEQCFLNRTNTYLIDNREEHRTDPATEWFISETDKQRRLKVMFVAKDGNVYLRSAYEPSPAVIKLYAKLSTPDGDLF